MWYKPKPGATIPDPENGNLPLREAGREIKEPVTPYWQRRIDAEDIYASTQAAEDIE